MDGGGGGKGGSAGEEAECCHGTAEKSHDDLEIII